MANIVIMPTLGQSMEEGTILQWFKKEGDEVRKGETLFEVMSDKANIEVEAEFEGVLRKVLVIADTTVDVNTPIAIIGAADESIEGLVGGNSPSEAAAPIAHKVSEPIAVDTIMSSARAFLSPRAQRVADEHGVAAALLAGRGTGPEVEPGIRRILEKDVLDFVASRTASEDSEPRTRVTPLAARIADDLGIDVGSLALGLPGSKIMAEDVRRHAAPAIVPAGPGYRSVPMKGLRKLIADNVARSRQTAPHVTLNMEIDVSDAVAVYKRLQQDLQKSANIKVTFTDLLIKAAARALADHPFCNAALVGDEVRLYDAINIGVAVAIEDGLIVPVIKGADKKGIAEVSAELKALAGRCREGKQSPDDLSGGTFTITNLGAFGIETFDPIIVPPQSCILGVGRIAEKPAVLGGEVAIRSMMYLSLSFDHRILDGVPAAKFLQRMRELLEAPLLIFV